MHYHVISVEKFITITDHSKNIDIHMLNRRNTSTAVLSVTSYSGLDFFKVNFTEKFVGISRVEYSAY